MEHTNRSVPTPAGGGLFRVGVDVGGTAVKIGLTDSEYNLTASISVPTGAERGAAEVLADIGRKTRAFLEEQGVSPEQCAGAGFGIPGVVDRASGRVVYSNNLRWQDVRAEEALSACLPMPIRMANDADCAALGETVAGAGRGCRDVVMITLGTGVGGERGGPRDHRGGRGALHLRQAGLLGGLCFRHGPTAGCGTGRREGHGPGGGFRSGSGGRSGAAGSDGGINTAPGPGYCQYDQHLPPPDPAGGRRAVPAGGGLAGPCAGTGPAGVLRRPGRRF